MEKNQRELWEGLHQKNADEFKAKENIPNFFAERCSKLIPKNSIILEIGAASGRDARFFVRENNCKVFAVDFSLNALLQLQESSEKDGTIKNIVPVNTDVKKLPFNEKIFDAIYSRSSLHLTDQELENFFNHLSNILKDNGFLMIEGKNKDDQKIINSKEIIHNIFEDEEGHIRRAWNENFIKEITKKFDFELLEINETTEFIKNNETKFISFIAQKIKKTIL